MNSFQHMELSNLKEYLTERPNVTFNKEVYKRHTLITNINKSYKFNSVDGFQYICDEICSDKLMENSYLHEIYLYAEDEEFLSIDDIISIEILIVSKNTSSILHKYSGLTLKAILLATNNLNVYMINLPINKFLFINQFVKYEHKLKITVNLNKFNTNLLVFAKYTKMLDDVEIKELNTTQPRRLIRHIVDETFMIEKGLNILKLSPNNMQCCLIFFTFPKNMEDVTAVLKIGKHEHQINKYYSNRHFIGLNDDPNIMIFDIYKNVSEFYNQQPTGNILLDGNATLTFDSDEIGCLTVGYVLLDLILYENAQIKFFDMKTEYTNKEKSIKYITIHKK